MIRKIRKRDGKISDFNPIKITNAIWKAAQAVGGKDYKKSIELTDKVMERLEKELKKGEIPTVEQVQDIVEKTLIEEGHAKTGKAYILYRKQHMDMREIVKTIWIGNIIMVVAPYPRSHIARTLIFGNNWGMSSLVKIIKTMYYSQSE